MRYYRLFIIIGVLLIMPATIFAQDDDSPFEPVTIENYDSTGEIILTELEDKALIPIGSSAIFTQAGLSFSGEDAEFSNFGVDEETSDFVMGITLNFAPQSDALEYCGMAGRTRRLESNRLEEGSNITTIRLNSYLAMGVDNAGSIFTFEIDGDISSDLTLSEDSVDTDEPVHLLAVALDNVLTIFVNGEPTISEIDLSDTAGAFAFLYSGMDEETSCQAESFFAFALPDVERGQCLVSSDGVVNRRSGPSTDFGRVGQFTGEETLSAIGQAVGTDGFVWWQLEDESWARSDVVNIMGYCQDLPEVAT